VAAAERYWGAAGVTAVTRSEALPLGLAFALRGGPLPAVHLEDGAVSVHAGHTIAAERPFTAGRYRLCARIADVFEKNGRSGPLTVIGRTAELVDAAGDVVVSIREQQIVRWPTARPVRPSHPAGMWAHDSGDRADGSLDIGATVALEQRPAPGVDLVRAYAGALGDPEPLFSDRQFARRIGFADVIVPGPIQATLFERLLNDRLSAWRLTGISLSFRVSVIVGEPIALRATVIELSPGRDRLVADLVLENSHGEVATAGTATLAIPSF
jgi:acyl dehydratase